MHNHTINFSEAFASEMGLGKAPSLLSSAQIAKLLLALDIIGLFICFQIALFFRLGIVLNRLEPFFGGFLLLVILGLYLGDAYRPDIQIVGLRAPARILLSSALVAVITAVLIYFSGGWWSSLIEGRSIWFPSLGLFTVWAVLLRLGVAHWLQGHLEQRHWLVLGTDKVLVDFIRDFKQQSSGQLSILAPEGEMEHIFNLPVDQYGTLDHLSDSIVYPWSGVILTDNLALTDEQSQQLMMLRLQGVPIYTLQTFYEQFLYKIPAKLLHNSWFMLSAGFDLTQGQLKRKIKRICDLLGASVLLASLLPFMVVVAIAIKLESPGPILYSQIRTGLRSRPFRVYKFRSMYHDAERTGAQWARKRDPRITKIGKFMRLTRFDELPQLFNVLNGSMSLIGPRPERPEFDCQLAEVISYYPIRYLVKPGITGWAQVMYHYCASIEESYEKLAYDLYYIKNYSIWLDMAIALKTIRVVCLGKGR